jgi:CMP-N-acetylneuraminic acid synthetase
MPANEIVGNRGCACSRYAGKTRLLAVKPKMTTTHNKHPKIAALVPMRHESARVPGKNYRFFAGKPLYHHILESLLACPHVTSVCIDTDSPIIYNEAPSLFPVKMIRRPKSLCSEFEPINSILLHDVTQIEADFYLQTHSTNPLLKTDTITRAIRAFLASDKHDSLFGVTKLHKRFFDATGQPLNHDPNKLIRTQDLPPIYEENSTIYLFSKSTLVERKNRIGYHPLMFEISKKEAIDIDYEDDFAYAEFVFNRQLERHAS